MINPDNIISDEIRALRGIPTENPYMLAIDWIRHCVHTNGGALITSGMGKAGQIAQNIATTFSSTGTPSIYLHPADAQHGDLGVVRDKDILLLVSNSGKTQELLDLVTRVEILADHNVPIISITGDPDSPLTKVSDVVILTGNPREVCPLGLTPTTSTTVMTVIGDILVTLMMDAIGFTKEDYAKRHHGGYLGVLSRNEAP